MKIKRICKNCGKEFEIYPSQVKLGEGVYCSNKCKSVLLRVLRVGATLSTEQVDKARKTRLTNYEQITCGYRYNDLWGKRVTCRNKRKRYRKTCCQHKYIVQRYFCSKVSPHYCIDIEK